MNHHLSEAVVGVKAVRRIFFGVARGTVLSISPVRRMLLALLLLALLAAPGGGLATASTSQGTYVVRRGDTLARISARTGVSVSALVRANGIINTNLIYVGQILVVPGSSGSVAPKPPPTSGGTSYIVQRGDTLGRIAARYGTTVSALMAANGISNADRVYVGQKLVIPGGKTPAPKPAPAPTAGRWIDINLSTQRLTAYQGGTPVFSTAVSTGVAGRRTPVGRFAVRTKLRAQTMSGPGYYLPNVPYVMYFAGANAIHGTYWHNNFGHPMSHGCVNLPTSAAAWVYNWAKIGTPVVTHY